MKSISNVGPSLVGSGIAGKTLCEVYLGKSLKIAEKKERKKTRSNIYVLNGQYKMIFPFH